MTLDELEIGREAVITKVGGEDTAGADFRYGVDSKDKGAGA